MTKTIGDRPNDRFDRSGAASGRCEEFCYNPLLPTFAFTILSGLDWWQRLIHLLETSIRHACDMTHAGGAHALVWPLQSNTGQSVSLYVYVYVSLSVSPPGAPLETADSQQLLAATIGRSDPRAHAISMAAFRNALLRGSATS